MNGATAALAMYEKALGARQRYALLRDPFGHQWALARRTEDLAPDEVQRRADAFYRSNRS